MCYTAIGDFLLRVGWQFKRALSSVLHSSADVFHPGLHTEQSSRPCSSVQRVPRLGDSQVLAGMSVNSGEVARLGRGVHPEHPEKKHQKMLTLNCF